ncbi:MAG TPA: aminodeoxychorismate synthase component I [Candidatus Binatia bacterium]|jgi:aminodeoxychorismate synthase component I|nr:aminodeoxychorismate synthase component I [Candidatus Binatia bacterium]
MHPLIEEISTQQTPESLVEHIWGETGVVLLRSAPAAHDSAHAPQARYSFVAARPFLTFRSFGSRCELWSGAALRDRHVQFGNPWRLLEALAARCELLEEMDFPFPLGGCFGYWGYDLRVFVEPKLSRRATNDLELPDCHVGFYDSLVVFDHHLGKAFIISTGLLPDGSCSPVRAGEQLGFWQARLSVPQGEGRARLSSARPNRSDRSAAFRLQRCGTEEDIRTVLQPKGRAPVAGRGVFTSLPRSDFLARVEQAKAYIGHGDIYQVNLSQRLATRWDSSPWDLFQRLQAVSPSPFSAYLDCGEFQIVSSSPELFLRLSGRHIQTRPIKGTRPRASDPTRDAQLTYELQTSPKEMAELVMITDLLRNDLGRVCEFGSIQVPELVRLERYAHVQHLVSTVEGRLRPDVTHSSAFASCFPGGSITGAPKFRAMEIIDELEPVARGPYTGALGYLGFNRESQLSIIIRAAICRSPAVWFHAGAGIVADSVPAAEYEETLAKARGFFEALRIKYHDRLPQRPIPARGAGLGFGL